MGYSVLIPFVQVLDFVNYAVGTSPYGDNSAEMLTDDFLVRGQPPGKRASPVRRLREYEQTNLFHDFFALTASVV